MTAYGNIEGALAGAKVYTDADVISRVAGNTIQFGAPVVAYEDDSTKAYNFQSDKTVATFDRDFEAGNTISTTVNGLSAATVPFSSSHADTKAALVSAIDALAGITAANSAGRAITVISKGAPVVLTTTVIGGTNQAVATQVTSCSATPIGVAVRSMKVSGQWDSQDIMPIMREGEIWVLTADAVVANKAAYITSAGTWTDEVGSNTATNYVFRTSTSGAALARLEVIK